MPVYNETDKNKWTKDKRHWFFRCSYEDLMGNKRRYKSKMYHTKDDAKEAESEFLMLTKNYDDKPKGILFETVFNEWLYYKKRKVKSATYYEQKKIANKHILAYFGKMKLHSIKESNVNQWYEKIANMPYCIKHKNKIIGFFREILTYAKNTYDYNEKNIMLLHNVKDENPITDGKITNFWTYEEFKEFIKLVDDEYYFLIFNCMYYTGCRIGELIALNWNDIDFKRKEINITKTLTSKIGNKSYIITSPKTKNSARSVQLTDQLVDLLKKHYSKEKKIIGFKKSWFVFGNVKHLSLTTLRTKLNYYLGLNPKIKKITIHGFRHSHVSLLIHLGCTFRDVAERIGDTIPMVQNTYYHMYPVEKTKAVELLNKL